MRLANRGAVVTGAGSGIGRATALRFAEEGAHVAVLDLSPDGAADTAALIEKAGGRALAVEVDVASAASTTAAFETAAGALGRIDVLCNNAGVVRFAPLATMSEADWDGCFEVNAKGVFLCTRAVLPFMTPPEGATAAIVNTASVAGLVGIANAAAYCASKGAVVAFTRAAALDLAPRRIRVNAICPGTVHTPMIDDLIALRGGGDPAAGMAATVAKYPIGRLGTPADIANAALFFACEESAFCTGTILAADGGMTAT
ncbi:MAG: SDR family NAD(P)-dependent oxidoreductase [Sporichthyaceae bacterium]